MYKYIHIRKKRRVILIVVNVYLITPVLNTLKIPVVYREIVVY